MYEPPLPSAVDAERYVISLILGPDANDFYGKVNPILAANDFYEPRHVELFRACAAIRNSQHNLEKEFILRWLTDRGRLQAAGGEDYIRSICVMPPTANAAAYAKIVRDKSRLRKLIEQCEQTAALARGNHGDDASFLQKAGADLRDLGRLADKTVISSNTQALRNIFLDIQERQKNKPTVTGLRTGLDSYDRFTTGLHGKQLTIIAARPGQGKSARLLQAADTVASSGIGVIFFSLEMTKEELLQRMISIRGTVPASSLARGNLSRELWDITTRVTGELDKLPLKIDDTPTYTIDDIRERALGAVDEGLNKNEPIGLIIVDYLQRISVRPEDRRRQRVDLVTEMAMGLKELAKETALPVIAAAALRRLPEGRPDKRPTMEDLREAGSIESEADVVALIHRPNARERRDILRGRDDTEELANELNEKPEDAEIIIDKARHGRTGSLPVRWRPQYIRFDDMPEDPGAW